MANSGSVYHITNVKSGTALDLSGTDRVSLIGWPSHQGDNQKWHFNGDGQRFSLRNVQTGKYVGLEDYSLRDAIKVIAVDNEVFWEVKPDDQDPSVYRFFVPGTVFNLDLTKFGDPNGNTPIEIWGKWEGRNQCWRLQQL